MNYLNLNDAENYYVLIKINNNTDLELELVNNKVHVIGIFSSRIHAEEKINSLSLSVALSNVNPNYIIQGPFSIDMPISHITNQNLAPLPLQIPLQIPLQNPRPNHDMFNPHTFRI
jgi:hypothetical protein